MTCLVKGEATCLEVKVRDHTTPQVTLFKYIGYIIQIEEEVNHRIQAGWLKRRRGFGVQL